jgi:trehalose 6-phosphate synthase
MTHLGRRLVLVSNRLPIVLEREMGGCRLSPASGGLVTALAPVLEHESGLWIGWTGTDDNEGVGEALKAANISSPYSLIPITLTTEEKNNFYFGFSNEILWPLFHDLQSRCNFDAAYWASYQRVNRKYAEAVAQHARSDDFIWVHDYHLLMVGKHLRELGIRETTAFFLHIPFPSPDIYVKLPWRAQVMEGLLEFDTVGLQTMRDVRNFAQCVRSFVRGAKVHGHGDLLLVEEASGRKTRVGAFPIGIDFDDFAQQASAPEIAARADQIRSDLAGRQVILGLDRLDYTKGIPERLKAFRGTLARFPELHRQVTLVQVVVPSREDIPKYKDLKLEIEQLVSEINGQYTLSGWVPVHFLYRNLDKAELLAYYRAAHIALITPLKDGMNLVAKEYCACSVDDDGVLILSEFAGAASQLRQGAILVNPNDSEGVAEAILQAFIMPARERRSRMRRLRAAVKKGDIMRWADRFFRSARHEVPADASAERAVY